MGNRKIRLGSLNWRERKRRMAMKNREVRLGLQNGSNIYCLFLRDTKHGYM